MTPRPIRLLIIEDVEDHALLIVRELEKGGFRPVHERVETLQELEAALDERVWDAVISDFNLPGFDGLDALEMMQRKGLDLPFLLVSGAIGEEKAAEVMKAGANDYIRKGNYARLPAVLERELRDAEVRRERRAAAEELDRYREHLEELVDERTGELVRTNEALQAEITERKRTEEALLKSEEMLARLNADLAAHLAELEERNQELEAFNRMVSHDLRQPLNIMALASQQIGMRCLIDDETCQEASKSLHRSIFRMNSMIDTLLSFSRSTHGELVRKEFDMSGLVESIIAELRLAEPARRVVSRVGQGITACADPQLVRVALENLLGNAWKYTARKEEAVVEFGVRELEGRQVYFVSDNGKGFDQADADKIFVPFQRLQGAVGFQGSGIGLATVERIIRRHGGRIWAEGAAEKGATFYFTLNVSC